MRNAPSLSLLLLTVAVVILVGKHPLAFGAVRIDTLQGEDVLRDVMLRLEVNVLAYRNAVESAYNSRCSSNTLNTCQKNNYDECSSLYPNQTCPSSDFAVISQCGKGELCNGLFDWSVSTVRLPRALADGPGNNPTDPQIIETICYSRQTDNFLKNLFGRNDSFWEDRGMSYRPAMYFGGADGAFRIFPGRQSASCGAYDPRSRAWYLAAVPWYISESSGGKDVVLIVDNSKSVGDDYKLSLFQNASRQIISSLTEFDRIALVTFNENAEVAGGYSTLMEATEETLNVLKRAIDEMKPMGRTNYLAGFAEAFNVLKNSEVPYFGPKCNTAILFITDQPSNYPGDVGAEEVITFIEGEMASFAAANSTQIFTYSSMDNKQIREISCGTDGIWVGLTNTTKVEDVFNNFNQFYALGLGNKENRNITAWAGPYTFFTGGIRGISVSALVYDRTINPALFLGAVGADLTMDKIENILGYGGAKAEETVKTIMESLKDTPTVICPIRLAECGLEAARRYQGGPLSVCDKSCENITGYLPKQCSGQDEYPDDLWANTALEDETYQDRVCCQVGESTTSSRCPWIDTYGEPALSNMEIFGIICAAIVGCEIFACVYWQTGCTYLKCKRKKPEPYA